MSSWKQVTAGAGTTTSLLAQRNSLFAADILRILTEERRTYHRECINESRSQQLFEVGDSVMVRVAVQSIASKNKVAKLEYRLLMEAWSAPTAP